MQVGFVGLGKMGQAMVPRLLAAGFTVTVWNRTAAKAQALIEAGAIRAESLAEVAQKSELILTMVTNDKAVREIYAETTGLLAGAVAGKLFLEMSTICPSTIQQIGQVIRAKGAALLDAPMSGTVGPARAGQLLALVGGEAADLARAQPVLEVLCRRIAHLGPLGSGTTMKLVLNMPMAIYWQALAEALAMGVQAGLELPTMLDLIADSPASLAALPAKIPVILGQETAVNFNLAGVRKDLVAMTATALALGVPTPTGTATLASFAAATAAEWGERDLAALIPYYLAMVKQSCA